MMSFLSQQSVDDLLAQVQNEVAQVSQASGVVTPVAPSAAGSSGEIVEIEGDVEPPPPRVGAGQASSVVDEAGLAGDFSPPPTSAAHRAVSAHTTEYQRLLAIEVPVIVLLGQRRMSVGEVMRLGVGAIIEFNKPSDDELELHINNKPVGKGHAVKVGENFGIKITGMGALKDTIRTLGATE